MKKILFNDKYGLTKAVLDGRKTQTRRIIKAPRRFRGIDVNGYYVYRNSKGDIVEVCMKDYDDFSIDEGQILPKYKGGELVAVAQSYRDCGGLMKDGTPRWDYINGLVGPKSAGWNNKMFVKAELMPHKILITDIWIERLQDISDEDCIAEGVLFLDSVRKYYFERSEKEGFYFDTVRETFAALIDKISGKGTWDKNPYVFVYDFKLVE